MEQMEAYNRCIENEEQNYRELETLEQCRCAIFEYIYRYGEQFDEMTVQQVLRSIHQWEDAIRRELMYTRLSKAFLAHQMKQPI